LQIWSSASFVKKIFKVHKPAQSFRWVTDDLWSCIRIHLNIWMQNLANGVIALH